MIDAQADLAVIGIALLGTLALGIGLYRLGRDNERDRHARKDAIAAQQVRAAILEFVTTEQRASQSVRLVKDGGGVDSAVCVLASNRSPPLSGSREKRSRHRATQG